MKKEFLIFISFFQIIFLQTLVKCSSIKLIDLNNLKNKPMKKSEFSFSPLDINFQYINMRNTKYTKLIKKYLNHVSVILGRLIYTRNYNRKMKYNRNLLKRFKIQLKEKEFEEKEIETDLLLLVKLVSYKTLVVKHKLYTRNDEDDSADSRRTYIALLNIKNNYEFDSEFSIDKFKLHIITEIFNIYSLASLIPIPDCLACKHLRTLSSSSLKFIVLSL